MSKEKISKIELLTKRQNNNEIWYNYRKGVITASKGHFIVTKINKVLKSTGGCVSMWSLYQNISRLFFANPDLPGLKYDLTMEKEDASIIFELMKKKYNIFVISECDLFLEKQIVLLE